MRNATDLLAQYAAYHRDRRNIVSHCVGVPLIVFAVAALLAKPVLAKAGVWAVTPAWVAFAMAACWYLTRGGLVLGLATSFAVGALVGAAQWVGQNGLAASLGWGAAVFTIGWLIQFVGHWYEGRKPAFVDDVVGLLVGPMFVVAEGLFSLGWNKSLQAEIERRVGPTQLRDMARIA